MITFEECTKDAHVQTDDGLEGWIVGFGRKPVIRAETNTPAVFDYARIVLKDGQRAEVALSKINLVEDRK